MSGILMKAFGIPKTEFDIHFRKWCIDNRNRFEISILSDTQKEYSDPQYPVYEFVPGSHVHFTFATQGKYSAPIRHIHTTKEPVVMFMVPDKDAGRMSAFNLSPAGNVVLTKNGTYETPVIVPATGLAANQDHVFVEIYGNTDSRTFEGAGYTIWAVGAVMEPKLSSDDKNLLVGLPAPLDAAKEGLIDGMIISVTKEGGETKKYSVEPKDFGKQISIPLSSFRSSDQEACSLSVTLTEYVLSNKDEKLYMPESKPASIRIGAKDGDAQTSGVYRLIADPGRIMGRQRTQGYSAYRRGNEVEYIPESRDEQTLLENIDLERSLISMEYEGNKISTAYIQLVGTCTTKRTETVNGREKVTAGEEACAVAFNLEAG